MRIRHLTSAHDADDSRILHRECRSLHGAGHDVAVIAGLNTARPTEAVPIMVVGTAGRRSARATITAWRVLRAALRERADLYHFHDPELIWVAMVLKARGHRVVYDVHEDLPKQVLNKGWIPERVRSSVATLAGVVEAAAARVLDGIVAATPSIAERFPARSTVVVQNFPSRVLAEQPVPPVAERPYPLVYTGGLTEVQGVHEVLSVVERLAASPTVVAGWFDDDRVRQEVQGSTAWENVDFRGQLTPSEVHLVVRRAQCGIVLNRPAVNYLDAYSTKMFEYMASGVPVVCSNFPLWRTIVESAGCGIAVDPLRPDEAYDAVRWLRENPHEAERLGANGRDAVLRKYNWESEFAKLEALYARLA